MNTPIEAILPRVGDIKRAAKAIDGIAHRTPLYRSEHLSRRLDANVFLKLECFQPTRVFKIRGAANRMLQLGRAQRDRGVVAASSGNHGLSVAYVARLIGASATIVVPTTAVREKVEAIKEQGATVVGHGRSHAERYTRAQQIQKERGAVLVHPFDDPEVIAGQGTIGLEILEDLPDVDTILVPVGGGGLISGISLAIKAGRPEAKIYGVQSEKAPSMYESLKADKPVRLNDVGTIADGLAPGEPGQLTFRIVKKYVDGVVLTSEDKIRSATRLALESLHLLIEPSGAAVLAALDGSYQPRRGENLVLVISGGNISLDLLRELLNES
jgi:threonine dehydratase